MPNADACTYLLEALYSYDKYNLTVREHCVGFHDRYNYR